MSEVRPAFVVHPPPESFNSAQPLVDFNDGQHDVCQNIQPGRIVIDIFPDLKFEETDGLCNFNDYLHNYPEVTFLQLVQKVCNVTEIKQCMNEECNRKRRKLNRAPIAEWKYFREWALTMVSCQLHASDRALKNETGYFGRVVHTLWILARYIRHDKVLPEAELFGVYELINWMHSIASYLHPEFRTDSPLRTAITTKQVFNAIQRARELEVCSNRLWNLAVSNGEKEEVNLPTLVKMLSDNTHFPVKKPKRKGGKVEHTSMDLADAYSNHDSQYIFDIKQLHLGLDHFDCNSEVCCFSNIDNTRVEQLHKCLGQDCGESLYFPPSEFNRQDARFAWWLENGEVTPRVADAKSPYMAVSHVWSDGTGGGVQGEGQVNRCLFNYFKGVAEKLKCTAIWWDTISIPLERKARQSAISRMHENFQEAAHVVIHDQGLIQLPWIDAGFSCLAILMSTWFTRAWTILELIMSKKGKVSVIFRESYENNQYVIKNLDEDILASHPAYASRGHWIASSIVRQLRRQQFNGIGDIQKILRTKNTSWPRDYMVIAGLLLGCKPKINTPGFIANTTREIILKFADIEESFLYHGHATITDKGPFSWCPFSLQDVSIRSNTKEFERVFVDKFGAVVGIWMYREINEEEAKKHVHPYSFHMSVEYRIRTALAQWSQCILLKNDHREDSQALLVIPVDVDQCEIDDATYIVTDCLYVGTVVFTLEWGLRYSASVRLGRVSENSDANAQEVMDKYASTRGLRPWGVFFDRKRNSIRRSQEYFD